MSCVSIKYIKYFENRIKKIKKKYRNIWKDLDKLELGDEKYKIKKGDLAVIPLNTWHKAVPDKELKILVVGVPAMHPDDHYFE